MLSELNKTKQLHNELKKDIPLYEKKLNKIRLTILSIVGISFVIHTIGFLLVSPPIIIGALLMLLGSATLAPSYFKTEDLIEKKEKELEECKKIITSYYDSKDEQISNDYTNSPNIIKETKKSISSQKKSR